MLTARITLGHDLRFLFTFLLQVCSLGNLRHEVKVFIHTRLLRVNTITNMEVKEKSVMRNVS